MATELKMTMVVEKQCKGSVRFDNVMGNMGAINAVYVRRQDLASIGAEDAEEIEVIVRKVR